MKLLRYGPKGAEKPGLLDADGKIRDLSGHVSDITGAQLSPASLKALAAIDPTTLPLVEGSPRYGCPINGVSKFIAVGLNFADHAAESNLPIPEEPVLFTKAVSCIQGANDPVMLPKDSLKTDWEVELGVVIGSRARYVSEADALDHVAGYVLINDVSERAFQIERGGTWDKGKGCDTFGPIGPWLVTSDEVGDPQNLSMWLEVNGQRKQDGSSKTMIFPISKLVSYISEFMTLEPGDLITTGTPPGVGMGQKPEPVYLKAGDEMRLGIEKLGEQRQIVVAWTQEGAVAARIVAEGGKVSLWDLDADGLKAAAEEVGASHAAALDVSDEAAVLAAATSANDALGRIDILVASAGITGATATVYEYPTDSWKRVFDINVNGVFYCCKAVVPFMLAGGYGRIVNVASAAVIGLTKSLGKELATKGVIANSLTPATFESPILEQLPPSQVEYMKGKIPMGRLGEVHESAAMVCFMASEECSFTTAATFDTSGGRTTF
ncbi:FAA hydrolase family protein [Aphelenchoides fujianensis]|nr:FAA hydrolase family protein [Aphelenchoides fujianensis]